MNVKKKKQYQRNYYDQSEFAAITWDMFKAREKSRVQGAIGFGFASHWLKNWRDIFKPTTKRDKSFENCFNAQEVPIAHQADIMHLLTSRITLTAC